MTISDELLDELLKGCKRPEDLLGDAGLMKELKIRLMERMLGAELTAHLGYEVGAEPPAEQANRRNGSATKRVKGSDGEVPLSVPRDREGSFEPELVKKGQTRIDGVDDKSSPWKPPLVRGPWRTGSMPPVCQCATSRLIWRIFTACGSRPT